MSRIVLEHFVRGVLDTIVISFFSSPLQFTLTITSVIRSAKPNRNSKDHVREPTVLSLPTLLLDYIPLHFPLRSSLRMTCDLQDLGCFSVSPHTKNALAYLGVRRREFGCAYFSLYHILKLRRQRLELL